MDLYAIAVHVCLLSELALCVCVCVCVCVCSELDMPVV